MDGGFRGGPRVDREPLAGISGWRLECTLALKRYTGLLALIRTELHNENS